MNKDKVIEMQQEIIDEYEKTTRYLNNVFMDVIRRYKDKPDRTEAETELMNFAWQTNDCLVDQPRIYELKRLLESRNPTSEKIIDELNKVGVNVRKRDEQSDGSVFEAIVGNRRKPLIIKYDEI